MTAMIHIVDNNKDRKRKFGKRVGDSIQIRYPVCYNFASEVVGIKGADNNSIFVIWEDGTIKSYVAEWCDIITKVEDRLDFNIDSLESLISATFDKLMAMSASELIYVFKDYDQEQINNYIIKPYRDGEFSIDMMTHYLSETEYKVFES